MPRLSSTRKQLLDAMMKDSIFDAAVSVLAEHGFKGMTMDRVAVAADMAKGSLYGHVGSKQNLLRFVHARIVDPIIEKADRIVHTEMPIVAKLDAILQVVSSELAKHQGVLAILLTDDSARALLEPSAELRRESAINQYAEVFRQGIEQGEFRDLDPRLHAEMFFAALMEPWKRAVAAGTVPNPARWTAPLMQVFLQGISRRPASDSSRSADFE